MVLGTQQGLGRSLAALMVMNSSGKFQWWLLRKGVPLREALETLKKTLADQSKQSYGHSLIHPFDSSGLYACEVQQIAKLDWEGVG